MNNTRKLVYTALLAALTAAGAFMRIPMGYSSVTLQYLFTAMAGLLLGRKWGALSQLIYVCLGLVGLPIFTMGGGFGYVFQPTFAVGGDAALSARRRGEDHRGGGRVPGAAAAAEAGRWQP